MGLRVSVPPSRVLAAGECNNRLHMKILSRVSIMGRPRVQDFQYLITKPQNSPERWGLLR